MGALHPWHGPDGRLRLYYDKCRPVPPGIRVITADATELEPLMMLDCEIRADIPGSEGWLPDPVWFREETYDSPFFDPQAYRVALDDAGRYVGLARVWKRLPSQRYRRLGCVGVLAGFRRRGRGEGDRRHDPAAPSRFSRSLASFARSLKLENDLVFRIVLPRTGVLF